MAKRFTDTNKYKKPFIRGLQGAYKVLWDYLYHDCDHAGIWIVDFEIAQIYVGSDLPINKEDALNFFNKSEIRIIEIDHGTKWFIPSFIKFQYGELKESNRAHNSVINILKNKNLISSLQGAKDMDKDKDKVKDKELDKDKEKEPDEIIIKDYIEKNCNGFSKELLQWISIIEKNFNNQTSIVQIESWLRLLSGWYKTSDQKIECLNKHIAAPWKTLNFVDIKENQTYDTKDFPL